MNRDAYDDQHWTKLKQHILGSKTLLLLDCRLVHYWDCCHRVLLWTRASAIITTHNCHRRKTCWLATWTRHMVQDWLSKRDSKAKLCPSGSWDDMVDDQLSAVTRRMCGGRFWWKAIQQAWHDHRFASVCRHSLCRCLGWCLAQSPHHDTWKYMSRNWSRILRRPEFDVVAWQLRNKMSWTG